MGVNSQPFTKFVEIGRIAYIAFGRDAGKICAIVDVIDQNRALIDGPLTRVLRQPCSFKRLHLTKFRIKIQHSTKTPKVRKAWEEEKITEKWLDTAWAKKLNATNLKRRMNDYDRFKLMKAKQSRNRAIKYECTRLKKKAWKAKAKEKATAKSKRVAERREKESKAKAAEGGKPDEGKKKGSAAVEGKKPREEKKKTKAKAKAPAAVEGKPREEKAKAPKKAEKPKK